MIMPTGGTMHELLIEAARRLADRSDPDLLQRLARGEVELGFVWRTQIADEIGGKSLEAAFELLNRKASPQLRKYFGDRAGPAPRPVPAGVNTKAGLIGAILKDAFGRVYVPPTPAPRQRTSAGSKRKSTAPPALPFDAEVHAARLRDARSVDDARKMVDDLGDRRAPYHDVAGLLGVTYKANSTVAQLRDLLTSWVRTRLDYSAYMRDL